jgi:hypothetical protein
MKKLLGLLFIVLVVVFTGCKKSGPTNLTEINAHVIDGGDPSYDGIGLYIKVDSTEEIVIPINLPAEYQQKGITVPVAIKFVDTGKRAHRGYTSPSLPGYRVIYIASVRKL